MKPDYVKGRWKCEGKCKDLIALNVVACNDGSFKCLYCKRAAYYNADAFITHEQFQKRFGYVNPAHVR